MGVAQLVEHRSPKPGVGSSSLSAHAIEWTTFLERKLSNLQRISLKQKTGTCPDFLFGF